VFDFKRECCCFTNQNTQVAINSTCQVICLVGTIVRVPLNAAECLVTQLSALDIVLYSTLSRNIIQLSSEHFYRGPAVT
jgi:hypothetical protein